MTQFLESNTQIITFITSIIFCYCSVRLAEKEDPRYTLSTRDKFFVGLMVGISNCLINFQNEDVAFITIFLMTSVISILSVSFMIDVKLKELPDNLTFLSLGLAIPFLFIANRTDIVFTLSSIAVVTLITYLVCRYLKGLGFGDVKLLIPILLFIPPIYFLHYWFNTIIIGLLFGIFTVIQKKDRKATFAFGPALILGLLTVFSHIFIL